jgi:hypothetical protein
MIKMPLECSDQLTPLRAVSTMPTQESDRRFTQRRVIDLKRHNAACCRCC